MDDLALMEHKYKDTDSTTHHPSLVNTVSDTLRRAILGGEFESGQALRQDDLARMLGVSRVPVREALLKLEGEGLVKKILRRGFIVTKLSIEDFIEILEMRYALENLALELAVPRFSDKDLKDTLLIIKQAYNKMPPEGDESMQLEFESRWGNLNWEFHRRLYIVANRPRLLSWIENLQHLFSRQLSEHINLGDDLEGGLQSGLRANRSEWEAVIEEHHQIALACARHDVEAAKEILKKHIFGHGKDLLEKMRLKYHVGQ